MPRVLVIDDDPSIRQVVRYVLTDEGYAVDEAPDGARALEIIEYDHPDLILLDMKMPVMDGWGFARRYRNLYGRRAPIIVVTAATDAALRGADIDAEGFLAKPFDLDDLIDCIESTMRSHAR